MGYKVITAVAGDVIPLADLRLHLKLDMFGGATTHPDDALITKYLADACAHAQHRTQKSIGQKTLELALDSFPVKTPGIELELGASAIVSIKYIDENLVEQTIASNLYALDDYSFKHWAIPVAAWPTPAAVANAVKVRYITPVELPEGSYTAILLHVTHFYENRSAVNADRGVNPTEIPLGVDALLDISRHWSL